MTYNYIIQNGWTDFVARQNNSMLSLKAPTITFTGSMAFIEQLENDNNQLMMPTIYRWMKECVARISGD
jgi:hypothetical protein